MLIVGHYVRAVWVASAIALPKSCLLTHHEDESWHKYATLTPIGCYHSTDGSQRLPCIGTPRDHERSCLLQLQYLFAVQADVNVEIAMARP